MNRRGDAWRERMPETITCVRCLQVQPKEELDRLLWCEECVARARRRANLIGWAGGAAIAFLVGLYIWFVIQPDLSLIPALWAATLGVALYLGGRISREIAYGVMRIRNVRAAEARPPIPETEGPDTDTPDGSGAAPRDPPTPPPPA